MSVGLIDPSRRSDLDVWCRAEMYSSSRRLAVAPTGLLNFISCCYMCKVDVLFCLMVGHLLRPREREASSFLLYGNFSVIL